MASTRAYSYRKYKKLMYHLASVPGVSFKDLFLAIINEGIHYLRHMDVDPAEVAFISSNTVQLTGPNADKSCKIIIPDATYTGAPTFEFTNRSTATTSDYLTTGSVEFPRTTNCNSNLKHSVNGTNITNPKSLAVLQECHIELGPPTDTWGAGFGRVDFRVTTTHPPPNGQLYLCRMDYTEWPITDDNIFFHHSVPVYVDGTQTTVQFQNLMPGYHMFALIWHSDQLNATQIYSGNGTYYPRFTFELMNKAEYSNYMTNVRPVNEPTFFTNTNSQYFYEDDKGVKILTEAGIKQFFSEALSLIKNDSLFPTSAFNGSPSHLNVPAAVTRLSTWLGTTQDIIAKENYQIFIDWLRTMFKFHTSSNINLLINDRYFPAPLEIHGQTGGTGPTSSIPTLNEHIRKNENFLSDLMLTWEETPSSGVESYDIEIMPDGAGTGYTATSTLTATLDANGQYEYTYVGDTATAGTVYYSGPGGKTEYYIGRSHTDVAWNGVQPCTWGTGQKPTTEHYIQKEARGTTWAGATKILNWIQNDGYRRFKITLQDSQVLQFTVNTVAESPFADGWNTQANSPNYPTNPYYPDGIMVQLKVTYDPGKGFDDVVDAFNTGFGTSFYTWLGAWELPTITGIYGTRGWLVEPIEITYPFLGPGSLQNSLNYQVKDTSNNTYATLTSSNINILDNGDKFKLDLGSSWANKAVEIQIEPIHGGFTIGNQQPYPSYYSSTNTAGSTYRIQDVKNTGIVVKLPNDWNPLVKTQTSGVFFSDNFPKNFYYSIIAKMSEMDNNYPVGDSSRIVRGGYATRKQQIKAISIDKNFRHIDRQTGLYPEDIIYSQIGDQGYRIHSFSNVNSYTQLYTILITELITIDLLLIGGGGAGGYATGDSSNEHIRYGGGGGGGEVRLLENITINPGYYTITVGKGGDQTDVTLQGNGEDTVAFNYIAKGGGRGGGGDPALGTSSSAAENQVGRDGGTGGNGGGGWSKLSISGQTTTLSFGSGGSSNGTVTGYQGGSGTASGAGGGAGAGSQGGDGPAYDSNSKFFENEVSYVRYKSGTGSQNWYGITGTSWYAGSNGNNGPSRGGKGVIIDFDGTGEKEYGMGGQGGGGIGGYPRTSSITGYSSNFNMPNDGPYLKVEEVWSGGYPNINSGVAWDGGNTPSLVFPNSAYTNPYSSSDYRFSPTSDESYIARGGLFTQLIEPVNPQNGMNGRGGGGGGGSAVFNDGLGNDAITSPNATTGGHGYVAFRYKWANNSGAPVYEYTKTTYTTYASLEDDGHGYLREALPNEKGSGNEQVNGVWTPRRDMFLNANMGSRQHIVIKLDLPPTAGTIINVRLHLYMVSKTSNGGTYPIGNLREIYGGQIEISHPSWNSRVANYNNNNLWGTAGAMASGTANPTILDSVDFSTQSTGWVTWNIVGPNAINSATWFPGLGKALVIYDDRTNISDSETVGFYQGESSAQPWLISDEFAPKVEVVYQA